MPPTTQTAVPVRDPLDAIRTASGRLFWPFEPREEEIHLEDVAHHLANLCRFTGASRQFYSIAQHCVMVSVLVPKRHALGGLFHDGAEAYLNDVSRPVKRRPEMAGYRSGEAPLQALLYRRFGVAIDADATACIKAADDLALHAELRDLMQGADPAHTVAAKDVRLIVPQRPELARELFIQRFHTIVNGK